jgi:tetratricopeptide (TPR) repeat protein
VDPNYTDALSNKASTLNHVGKSEEALSIISPIVESNPDDEYALSTMAYSLYDLKRYDEAKNYFTQALQLNPNLIEILTDKEVIAFNNIVNQSEIDQLSSTKSITTSNSTETTISNEKNQPSSKIDELLKLSDLKDKGIISEEEFRQLKQNILNSDG